MKVFISHSSKDNDLVRKIADELKRSGMDTWDDTRILPGENWAEKISQALQESEAMIVLLTPDSINSKWMNWEIEYALGKMSYNKRLIPVLVGDLKKFPQESIPWIFQHLKTINLPEQGKNEDKIRQIAEAIKEAA